MRHTTVDTAARRRFIRTETDRLGRFIGDDLTVGWWRSYRCDCGYTCTAPGDIWDHECDLTDEPPRGAQLLLPLGGEERGA